MYIRFNFQFLRFIKNFISEIILLLCLAPFMILIFVMKDGEIKKLYKELGRVDFENSILELKNRTLERRLNRNVYVVSNLKKNDEWFVMMHVGNSPRDFVYASNLNIDVNDLNYIIHTCTDSGIPLWFLCETLWRESRFGSNIKHKKNRDGSIDGGWFALNSRNHHPSSLGNPRKDVFKFIKFFKKDVEPFPKNKWHTVYRFGETRARKLGLIQ